MNNVSDIAHDLVRFGSDTPINQSTRPIGTDLTRYKQQAVYADGLRKRKTLVHIGTVIEKYCLRMTKGRKTREGKEKNDSTKPYVTFF
jgi:hypothetical protein